jgi:hypothetical protein
LAWDQPIVPLLFACPNQIFAFAMRRRSATLAPTASLHDQDVLGRVIGVAPAPLLPNENQADYAGIAARIADASRPTDAIEDFLVRDVIDLTWEIVRLRRVKTGIIRASTSVGVHEVLEAFGYDYFQLKELCERWAVGNKNTRREVSAILARAGMTIDEITAKTFEARLDSLERVDRMLGNAEARRNNALREIDRHRETLAAAVRRSINNIEDADFRDVETGEITAGQA